MAIVRLPSGWDWTPGGTTKNPLQNFLDTQVSNGDTVRPPAALADPVLRYDSFAVNNKQDVTFEPEPGNTFTLDCIRPSFTRWVSGCHIRAGSNSIDADAPDFLPTDVGRAVFGPGFGAGGASKGFQVITYNSPTRITIRDLNYPATNLFPTADSDGSTIMLGRPSTAPLKPMIEVVDGSGIHFRRILGIGSSPPGTIGIHPGAMFNAQHFIAFYGNTATCEVTDCNIDSVMGDFVNLNKSPTVNQRSASTWIHHNRMGSFTANGRGTLGQARTGNRWIGMVDAQDIAIEDNTECWSANQFIHGAPTDLVGARMARMAALRNDIRNHGVEFVRIVPDYRVTDIRIQDNTDRTLDANNALRILLGATLQGWQANKNLDRRNRLIIQNNQTTLANPDAGGHKFDVHGWVNFTITGNKVPFTVANIPGSDAGVTVYCCGNYTVSGNNWGAVPFQVNIDNTEAG